MSASSGPLASTKGDSTSSKSSKPAYDHLDINKLYKGKSTEPVSKPVTQKHGMQILGKAIPARRPGQLPSVKAENSSSDASSSATSGTTTSSSTGPSSITSTALASNQSQGNVAQPGWSASHPHPPGPPSPRSVPSAPVTGQHPHDKNWNSGPDGSGPYQSQRFAQEFPSLASGTDTPKAPPGNASGPSSNLQGSQSLSKPQDNQYGPGPILRPQTEGSWTQGGGRGVPRPGPPGPAPPMNAPSREFQGPERANLGGPTPPPMSLGQGGPAPPPLGAFPIPPPYRGMVPPHYMYPNGPPPPGPGFYPGSGNMSRFAMPIPPRAPPPSSGSGPDGPPREMNRSRPLPPMSQRPTVFAGPIIKEEELKQMDQLGGSDGGWASTQDDIDYNKTLQFSDEEDSTKENLGKKLEGFKVNESRGDHDRGRDRDENVTIERRPTKILDRQSSIGERENRDRGDRDVRERDQREARFENIPNKDSGLSRGVSYGYENDEDWKAQQLPMPPPQQQQRRVNLYDDKVGERRDRDPRDRRDDPRDRREDPRDRRDDPRDRRDDPRDRRDDPRDRRDDPRDRRDDRGGRRPVERREDIGDNWRSSSSRQFDDENRKGPPPRGRDEPRSEGRDFPKTSNLPPRFQRQQQFHSGPGGPQILQNQQQQQPNQRQTPSPGSSGGKDREFSGNRDWDRDKGMQDRRRMDIDSNRKREGGRDRYYNEYDSRERVGEKDFKNSRYGSEFQRERSKESDDSKMNSSAGAPQHPGSVTELPRQSPPDAKESLKKEDSKGAPMTSWADEVDDDENNRARELERKREPSPKPVSQPKTEARRVYIRQTKISDMPPPKPEPQVEVKQSSEPSKLEQDHTEKVKPVWGEKENWDKANNRNDKESSPPHRQDKSSGGAENERRSQDRDFQSGRRQSPQSNSVPVTQKGLGSSATNGPSESSKPTPISKSASSRSISGELESNVSLESQEQHLQRSNSISDASDRDHPDKETSSDFQSKPPYNRQTSSDKVSSGGSTSGYDSKSKQRPSDRDRRVKRDSDRDGSDVGSEHGGSRGDKSQRGQRNRDNGRGNYPVYRTRERGGWERGNNRARGTRGRGSSGGREGHYYDKVSKRNDSDLDQPMKEENSAEHSEKSKPVGNSDEQREKIENQTPKKDTESPEENIPRPKKDKDLENNAKKSGKPATNKRSNNSRGGNKLEGYGPPTDLKPFSGSSNKDEDGSERREKDVGLQPAKDGAAIPSLMAVDISPPALPQLKKGHRDRDREYHSAGRAVPPRMQGQRGEPHPDRDRHRSAATASKRGSKDAAPGATNAKKEGEESEEWTDNDSDAESRKSGSASSKSKKESHQDGKKAVKKPQQEKGFTSNTTGAKSNNRPTEKGGKAIRVKNPPYEARSSAHSNLPPRLAAAKQRDTQGPAAGGNGQPGENGVEPAAPPQQNAWEKPITPTLRSEQTTTVPTASTASTVSPLLVSKESPDSNSANVTQISGPASSGVSAVLDGTNPPSRTMIFENQKYKGGAVVEAVKAGVTTKLLETKKETVPTTTGIEFGKNLGSLGFVKGAGEESPVLDFSSSPLDDPLNVPQSQASAVMMTTHVSSPKPSALLPQSSRHSSFDHQPSPTSRGDVQLKQKIESVKGMWDPPMSSVSEQMGVCPTDDTSFHGPFVSDSFKGADSSSRDFGPSSLPQSVVGYSGGSSPSISTMANPETSSSPNPGMRPTSKTPQQQQQQPPVVTKSQAHGPGPIASPFGYGIEAPQHISANSYGGIAVAPQPKFMYAHKVVPLDPFSSQMTQFTNAQAAGCGPSPYGQGGSVLIQPKFQTMSYQQHAGNQNRQSGQPTNHNRVSPGPITSASGANSAAGPHMNSRSNTLIHKNQQPSRNAGHGMSQQVPPQAQQNYYHTHNPMSQQQVPKGPFGPANGGYSDGGMTPTYQPQILIPVDVNQAAMFNIGGNFESSDLRSGPPPQGPAPPGTPPVQAPSSNFYYGSNNNPAACVFPPPNSSQNFGLPFTASLKMPAYNSTGGAGSESGSNLGSQRMRPNEHQFIQQGMDPLPQNPMKSGHDYLVNQQRWNSGNEYQVNQGMHWAAPGPIQRPIFNTPSAGPVGVPMVHSSHFMPPNLGAPPGCVGMKPNNSSNDSMTNPGTPPKSPHPRKNV